MNHGTMLRALLPLVLLAGGALAQDDLKDRVEKLETENRELLRRFDALAEHQETLELGELVPELGDGEKGLAPAASKVYRADGLSIGGYGEALYQNYAGNKTDTADFLRAVLYFGYRFDESWLFNSEIEFEHASTGEGGEASVEFAYLEHACGEDTSVRAGLLLVPMGFLNELHEPTTFLGATRPETESRILPTTWRELGAGVVGEAGPWSYRVTAVTGFDGEGFSQAGLRGGRQKGSRAKAEDFALVARADWVDTPGVLAGASVYHGDSGQETAGLGDTATTIVELHGEVRTGGLWARCLVAMASVDDVAELNAANGYGPTESVGEELSGGYVELGYDLMRHLDESSTSSLTPFLRYERIDTQAEVPSGFTAAAANDFDVVTVGLNWKPIDRIVLKLDYQDFEVAEDRVNLSIGCVF